MAWQYIQYQYPVVYNFEKMIVWADSEFECYFALRERADDTWTYYAGTALNELDTGKKLINYGSIEANAQTNHVDASIDSNGKFIAVLPILKNAKYVRIYVDDTNYTQFHEFRPSTKLVADEIITGTLEITDEFLTPPVIKISESGNTRMLIGSLPDSHFGLIGYDGSGNRIFEISDDDNRVGGWEITQNTLVNDSGFYIDALNSRIRSGDYVSGAFGAGLNIDPDLLETGNAAIRGKLRTAVFQKEGISAIGGSFAALDADTLTTDMTVLDSSTLTIDGDTTFSVGTIVRAKAPYESGVHDEWMEITGLPGAGGRGDNEYAVDRDKAGNYTPDNNPTWKKGAAIVNYGQSGDGGVYMTASDTNAPYLSVFTHSGSPWTDLTTHLRLGNLNGFLGYVSDIFGLGFGSSSGTNANITLDPTNGIRLRIGTANKILLKNDGTVQIIGEGGGITNIDGGNIQTDSILAASIAADQILAEHIKALEIDTGHLAAGSITSAKIAVGQFLVSSDWTSTTGVKMDFGNRWLKMGGSNVTAAGAAAGIFLGLDTSYKFYVGNGVNKYIKYNGTDVLIGPQVSFGINSATWGNDGIQLQYNAGNPRMYVGDGVSNYFQFNGTNTILSSSGVNAIIIKNGANILLEAGGDLTLTSSDTNASQINFGSNYHMGVGATADRGLCLYSDSQVNTYLLIGKKWDGTFERFYNGQFYFAESFQIIVGDDWPTDQYCRMDIAGGVTPSGRFYAVRDSTHWSECAASAATTDVTAALRIKSDTYLGHLMVRRQTGSLEAEVRASVFRPYDAGGTDSGNDTYYWNGLYYKTLTDKGCLGVFDDGVELIDGRIVSDVDALKSIQVDAMKETVYGVPMYNYKTMPKAVYKPPKDSEGNLYPRDENDDAYRVDEETGEKIIVPDGAEITALISIMLGAIIQNNSFIEGMNSRLIKLEDI